MTCFGWLAAVVCLSLAGAARAADQPHKSTAVLACGGVRLQARTTSVAHVPPDDGLVWTAQEITLQAANGLSQRLRVQGIDDVDASANVQGMPAIVSSWQCLTGSQGKVIELWLACNRPKTGAVCRGEREWERLIDLDGRPLDVGYAPQDPRYEDLLRRLGIHTDGIKLEDALGD